MICPCCQSESGVSKSVTGRDVIRRRRCPCGASWTTKEVMVKGTLVASKGQVGRATNGQTTSEGGGGVSALSGPLFPDPSSSPLSKQSPARTRAGRPNGHAYDPEFDRIWDACVGSRSKGNKLPAHRAWLKEKPSADLTIAAWTLWMTTSDWAAGFSPDMRKWIHNRGWADKPGPEAFAPRRGGMASARESFDAVRARERHEAQESAQREIDSDVAVTARRFNRCAKHLYNRTWGDCNPRCPEWKKEAVG